MEAANFNSDSKMASALPPTVQSLIVLLAPVALLLLEKKPLHKIPALLGLEGSRLGWQASEGAKLFLLTLAVLFVEVFFLEKLGWNDSAKVADVLLRQDAVTLLAIVSLAPLGEELLFRGYLQKKTGVVISSALFAGLHYGFGSAAELAAAFSASLIFGWFVRANKVVLPAVIAHALVNAYSLATVFLAK